MVSSILCASVSSVGTLAHKLFQKTKQKEKELEKVLVKEKVIMMMMGAG